MSITAAKKFHAMNDALFKCRFSHQYMLSTRGWSLDKVQTHAGHSIVWNVFALCDHVTFWPNIKWVGRTHDGLPLSPCCKFGDCSFSRFGSSVRTNRYIDRRGWTLYSRESRRREQLATLQSLLFSISVTLQTQQRVQQMLLPGSVRTNLGWGGTIYRNRLGLWSRVHGCYDDLI